VDAQRWQIEDELTGAGSVQDNLPKEDEPQKKEAAKQISVAA
jgi:hypothetical protein